MVRDMHSDDPQQPELLRVCRIGRAQGLKGEVTVQIFTDEPEYRFAPGAVLYTKDGEEEYVVESSRTFKNRWIVKFEGIDNRDQSEAANGCEFVHYWMHNGFINVDNQKMSKSLHNFFTVRDVADLYGYEPIRYFMLTAGYRMPLNYTVDLIESCKNSLERLYTCRENLDFALTKDTFGTDETLKEKAAEARTKFCTAMDDDLNTPDALAAVFDLVKEINTLSAVSSKDALQTAAAAFDEITGVLGLLYNRKKDEVPAEVTELVEKRAAAKKAKDWATADAIRAQLTELGWAVKDTAQGPQLSKL